MVRPGGALEDRGVRDLPDLLNPGDALVVNDTKVIPARLTGRRIGRDTEPKIEATLTERLDGSRWRAFVRPAKKLAAGDVVRFGEEGKVCFLGQLDATVEAKGEGGEVTLSFAFHGPVLDQAIAERGDMPLPPYIASQAQARRRRTAPTTRPCSRATKARSRRRPRGCISPTSCWRGSRRAASAVHKVTLHVGPGTFLPVHADDTADHKMHAEHAVISAETADALNAVRAARRPDRRGRLDLAAHARERGGRQTARSGRSPATPRSSSRRAIASRRST